jgi:hypothetical protein
MTRRGKLLIAARNKAQQEEIKQVKAGHLAKRGPRKIRYGVWANAASSYTHNGKIMYI